MKSTLRLIFPIAVVAGATGCASVDMEDANARLENRLDRRNEMADQRLERLDIRNEARGERWELRSEQADRAADAQWDRWMGDDF